MRVGNYNKCNKRRRKQGLIGLGVVTLFIVGLAIALIVMGYDDYDYGQELKENSSLEGCEIITSECDIMIAPAKCGYNTTLSQAVGDEIGCSDIENIESINETYSCYVNNGCDHYSFDQYDTLINDGYNNLVAGITVMASIMFIWLLVTFLCLCNTQCNRKYDSVDTNQ